jgi:hypothetical protein
MGSEVWDLRFYACDNLDCMLLSCDRLYQPSQCHNPEGSCVNADTSVIIPVSFMLFWMPLGILISRYLVIQSNFK